jgi:hypothetical protein
LNAVSRPANILLRSLHAGMAFPLGNIETTVV